jgi:ammonia channel protein AmtB
MAAAVSDGNLLEINCLNNALWTMFGIAGLMLAEAGMSHTRNLNFILFKTILQIASGFSIWWLVGYGFAFGDNDENTFINGSNFAGDDFEDSTHASKCLMYGSYGLMIVFIVNCICMERM